MRQEMINLLIGVFSAWGEPYENFGNQGPQ